MSRWASDGVGDRRGVGRVGQARDVGVGESRDVQRGKAGVAIRREPGVVGEGQAARVVVGPGEVVHLPAIEREEPTPALAVDRVGEADRGELG